MIILGRMYDLDGSVGSFTTLRVSASLGSGGGASSVVDRVRRPLVRSGSNRSSNSFGSQTTIWFAVGLMKEQSNTLIKMQLLASHSITQERCRPTPQTDLPSETSSFTNPFFLLKTGICWMTLRLTLSTTVMLLPHPHHRRSLPTNTMHLAGLLTSAGQRMSGCAQSWASDRNSLSQITLQASGINSASPVGVEGPLTLVRENMHSLPLASEAKTLLT